jgi:GH15 family glucan-1,4-alpha-glucosidase
VCNFWLADALARAGRVDQAHAVFARTIGAANDVGLLAEQYDPGAKIALGNVPQGLSHLGLIGAALSIRDAQARAGAPTVEAKAGG